MSNTNNHYEQFADIEKVSDKYGETNDCGVKALSYAMDITYEEAHNALSAQGRIYRKGTYRKQLHTAIKCLGGYTEYTPTSSMLKSLYTGTTGNNNVPKKGVFIIHTASHVLCMVDGDVKDFTKGRRHRIKAVFEVTKTGKTPTEYSKEIVVKTTPTPRTRKARTSKNNWVVKLNGEVVRYYQRRPKFASNIHRCTVGNDPSTMGQLTIERL